MFDKEELIDDFVISFLPLALLRLMLPILSELYKASYDELFDDLITTWKYSKEFEFTDLIAELKQSESEQIKEFLKKHNEEEIKNTMHSSVDEAATSIREFLSDMDDTKILGKIINFKKK